VINKENKPVRRDLIERYLVIETLVKTNREYIVRRLDCPRNIYLLEHRADTVNKIVYVLHNRHLPKI
jgi:hypothetical protein